MILLNTLPTVPHQCRTIVMEYFHSVMLLLLPEKKDLNASTTVEITNDVLLLVVRT